MEVKLTDLLEMIPKKPGKGKKSKDITWHFHVLVFPHTLLGLKTRAGAL